MPQSKEGKRYLRSALALAVAGAFAAMHPAWADVPELETNSDGAYINVTAGTGTGETQSVTGDAVSITNSGNAHALTLTGTGNTILIDGTESVSITANSQYAPISNFSGNPWAETPSSYSAGGTIDIESDGTVTLSNTAGGNNQVIDIENGDSDTPLKLTVNGEKTAAQVVMTGNVLTQNEYRCRNQSHWDGFEPHGAGVREGRCGDYAECRSENGVNGDRHRIRSRGWHEFRDDRECE